jgi:hypothetical protein
MKGSKLPLLSSSLTLFSMKTLLETVADIGPSLASCIEEEETNRKPAEQTIVTLKQHGLLKLFLPKSLGGLETDPVTVAHLVEAVALHNTGAAWSMMVANVSAWWGRQLPEKGIEAIFKDDADVGLAGAFHPPMKATRVKDGYSIHGRSPLTSNAIALRVFQDTESAQDAFVMAYLKLSQLHEPNNFGGWLRQIVTHTCPCPAKRNTSVSKVCRLITMEIRFNKRGYPQWKGCIFWAFLGGGAGSQASCSASKTMLNLSPTLFI